MIEIATALTDLNVSNSRKEINLRFCRQVHEFINELDLEVNPYRSNCLRATPHDVKVDASQSGYHVNYTIFRAAFGTEIEASFTVSVEQVEKPETIPSDELGKLAKAYQLFYNKKLRIPSPLQEG